MAKKTTEQSKRILKIVIMAMLAALAVVIGLYKIPIIPMAPWLTLDFADIPILIAAMLFGTVPGLIVLFVVCMIQAFLLGGDGWIGLIMHFVSSGILVILVGILCRRKQTLTRLIITAAIGVVLVTAVMIPMNYIFTPILNPSATKEVIDTFLLPAIIPYNLVQTSVSGAGFVLLFMSLRPFLKKNNLI